MFLRFLTWLMIICLLPHFHAKLLFYCHLFKRYLFCFNKVWLIDCWFCSVVQCHCIVLLSIIMTIMTIKPLWLQPWTELTEQNQQKEILISLNTQTMDCACDLLHFSVVAAKGFALSVCQRKHRREFGIRVRSFDCCLHIRYVLAYCWWLRAKNDLTEWKREKENKNFSNQRSGLPTLRSFRGVQPNYNQESLSQSERGGGKNIANCKCPPATMLLPWLKGIPAESVIL